MVLFFNQKKAHEFVERGKMQELATNVVMLCAISSVYGNAQFAAFCE